MRSDSAATGRATSADVHRLLRHRAAGAALLRGQGLEIGALQHPLTVPNAATVEHLDVEDAATLRRRFPELDAGAIVERRWVGDIVRASVLAITGRRFDFVVLNHVLEHVANPIQVLVNAWEGLADGGHLVLAVRDRQFSVDRERPLTSFEHMLAEFFRGVTAVHRDHYVEVLESARPDVFRERDRFLAALEEAAGRREPVHVWDSASFQRFWERIATLLGLESRGVYESTAASNRFEYFLVAQKSLEAGSREDESMRVLAAVYRARGDLQHAFPPSGADAVQRLLGWATTAGATIDSDAAVLRVFQGHYRRLQARVGRGDGGLEQRLRTALVA